MIKDSHTLYQEMCETGKCVDEHVKNNTVVHVELIDSHIVDVDTSKRR